MNVQRQRSGFDSYHIHQYHLHINGLTEVQDSSPPITSAIQVVQESARRYVILQTSYLVGDLVRISQGRLKSEKSAIFEESCIVGLKG